ncbi:uroporphyrinogen-III synthase [Lysobacter sp. N42]|uniref:uroporphyrinogen-III synthase n=1 Tax=Lysobacter sp. N42 TaxID=2545719 RepID=UPI001FB766D5|nr:uroporphyrinogen-III synthase [Lysobacter sp. N42]
MDSEGLLALPMLAQVAGVDIGLVTAPGGRGVIAPALQARGARVHRADVYAREPVRPSPRALATILALESRLAVAVSSAEALQRVMEAVDAPVRARLVGARVLAASRRVEATARTLGFDDVVVAAGPRPAQLVAALDDAD